MKKYMIPEVELINLDTNDILTTSSLNIGDPISSGRTPADAPTRIAIFENPNPAPEANSNSIW